MADQIIEKITDKFRLRPGELKAFAWSFIYFFVLLCGYYILKPVRDEMGIQGGIDNLQWVFTGTFVVMLAAIPLFGWAVGRFKRATLIPVVYGFFIFNLVIFYTLFRLELAPQWTARAFFIWVSVYNLFVVSVFWSFMADIFNKEQAKRLFGSIAAGGSFGAVTGPIISAGLTGVVGVANLIPISIGLLLIAVLCVTQLNRLAPAQDQDTVTQTKSGAGNESILSGITAILKSKYLMQICTFLVLYSTLATFLYFTQAQIIKESIPDSAARTTLFAQIELIVNSLTILIQLSVTARLVEKFGIVSALVFLPLVFMGFFLVLGFVPSLAVLVVFQVIRRAGNYAVTKPAREMLFTTVSGDEKYKAKNVIDTVVYRGGDAVSGWLFTGLTAIGLNFSAIALIAVPVAGLWFINGYRLGKAQPGQNEPATTASDVAVAGPVLKAS